MLIVVFRHNVRLHLLSEKLWETTDYACYELNRIHKVKSIEDKEELMTREDTLGSRRAELASVIAQALTMADELKQPLTAIYLDQALNSALSSARAASNPND